MSFIQTIIAWFITPAMPLYLGGKGGSSQANTSTATSTNTSSVNTDQSMMGGDNAVGLNGNSNIVDKSVVNNTAFNDSSDRSTTFVDSSNKSTNFSDSSNKSTNFADSSVKSTVSTSSSSTVNTVSDFGSVTAALAGMGKLSDAALDFSGVVVKDSIKGLADQSKDNIAVLSKAFEFASKSSAADAQKYTDVLGFAKDNIAQASAAYAEAKDGGANKTLLIAAVATVGVVGLAFAFKG
ncbi:hypothetical protein [Pseudoduganella sp. UC29_71]|uniref:hypothetical protein n=1 Tax=Pseudoduganella sp. UC29_71 TaxID=3350174 RepID=UPI003671BC3C